jgi:electron transfer flavoprotein beta subunit
VDDPEAAAADGMRTARLLAAAVERRGGADLLLCGRQGSDYDQGVVPAVLAELLETAYITLAAELRMDDGALVVRRVTPLGDEVVQADLPATVTVSNELGTPRYPTAQGRQRARRTPPEVYPAADLLEGDTPHVVELVSLAVPDVQGHCELLSGDTAEEQAAALLDTLRRVGVLDA